MKSLLEAGVHFGHQTRRWNPKMKRFIFAERNGIHIIDLEKTANCLEEAYQFVVEIVAAGKTVLFVGTKRQAQDTIESEAKRCVMPYVNTRWLGGTLTNFHTIQGRIDHLVRLEDAKARGELEHLTKKELLRIEEEIVRLNRYLGGIKEMTNLPGAVSLIDTSKEDIAVAESLRTDIPILALVDTNCDPDVVDYPIPSNDDAIRAIKLIASRIADSVLEGLTTREYAMKAAEEAEAEEGQAADYKETGYVASPDEPTPDYGKPAEEEATGAAPAAEAPTATEEPPAQDATQPEAPAESAQPKATDEPEPEQQPDQGTPPAETPEAEKPSESQ
ncbi:MAG: 30S ribosomal protein S2 [Dehalococcoidia bacterium]